MGHLQIKNLPEPLHVELRRRAEQAGMSIRDYVLDLIERDLAVPSARDWLASLDDLEVPCASARSEDLVAQSRRDRESRASARR